MSVAELKKLLSPDKPGDLERAKSLLSQLKLQVISLDPSKPGELSQLTDILEQACFHSILSNDLPSLERHYAILRSYYDGYDCKSQNKSLLKACYLMCLLSQNKSADFHLNVELLTSEDRKEGEIRAVLDLEENLMEGSYHKVLEAHAANKNAYFAHFLTQLVAAVRDRICTCAEEAYKTLPVTEAAKLLMLENEKALLSVVENRGWTVRDNNIYFGKEDTASLELNALSSIKSNLVYATNLERIV